ncbi:MAG: hypothetical protein RLZZ127_965 [Planctomycetota bacterium]|jgi:type II secretory pathway component PulJ
MLAPLIPPGRRASRGWTLVSAMVAAAAGLLVLAGLMRLVVAHVDEQRRMLLDARLTQDLRTILGLLTRDLQRAGHRGDAARGVAAVWRAEAGATGRPPNPYQDLALAGPPGAPWLGHAYSRDLTEDGLVANQERFGVRLVPATQVVEWRLSGSALTPDERDHWQPLTDPAVLRVTRLAIRVETVSRSLRDWCPVQDCAAADGVCGPVWRMRRVEVELEARDALDGRIRRRMTATARPRNDEVIGDCPA